MTREGVDYSACPSWWTPEQMAHTLRDLGYEVVGRYAVDDKSPAYRGITNREYTAMTNLGILIYLYWEGQVNEAANWCWTLDGAQAGINAAQNFNKNLDEQGIPAGVPGIFAHDIDPQPAHFPAIDDCFRGIADTIGPERTGCYAGWLYLDHIANTSMADIIKGPKCQPQAWERFRGLHPIANIWQYNSSPGVIVNGVSCDAIRTITEHFGQTADYIIQPTTTTTTTLPPVPPPVLPAWWAEAQRTHRVQHLGNGNDVTPIVTPVKLVKGRNARKRTYADKDAPIVDVVRWDAEHPFVLQTAYVARLQDQDGKWLDWAWDQDGYAWDLNVFATSKLPLGPRT